MAQSTATAADKGASRIVVIQGHPDATQPHFAHALAHAYITAAQAVNREVYLIDVGSLDVPFLRSRDDFNAPSPPTIAEAQAAIRRADHILLIYPIWNGTAPARLRAFMEQVFRPAFTLPDAQPGDRLGVLSWFSQRKGLAGKSARIVVTMAMPAWIYRFVLRPHPERNALRLAGVSPVRESAIGRADGKAGRRRTKWLDRMARFGTNGQ